MDLLIRVTGMTCNHCEQSVTSELMKIAHVNSVVVDLATGDVAITSSRHIEQSVIIDAVAEAGYSVAEPHE